MLQAHCYLFIIDLDGHSPRHPGPGQAGTRKQPEPGWLSTLRSSWKKQHATLTLSFPYTLPLAGSSSLRPRHFPYGSGNSTSTSKISSQPLPDLDIKERATIPIYAATAPLPASVSLDQISTILRQQDPFLESCEEKAKLPSIHPNARICWLASSGLPSYDLAVCTFEKCTSTPPKDCGALDVISFSVKTPVVPVSPVYKRLKRVLFSWKVVFRHGVPGEITLVSQVRIYVITRAD